MGIHFQLTKSKNSFYNFFSNLQKTKIEIFKSIQIAHLVPQKVNFLKNMEILEIFLYQKIFSQKRNFLVPLFSYQKIYLF